MNSIPSPLSQAERIRLFTAAKANPSLAIIQAIELMRKEMLSMFEGENATMRSEYEALIARLVTSKAAEFEDKIPDLASILANIKGNPGIDADNEAIAAKLITEFLPLVQAMKPENGKTPTPLELTALMVPLIKENMPVIDVQDGETPTDEKLLELIEHVMPTIEAPLSKEELIATFTPIIESLVPQITPFILTGKAIIDEINKLAPTPDLQIDWKHIKNAPRPEKSTKMNHGGGDKVVAGTGILITRNSNGTTTITNTGSSGGGGGTTTIESLTPTAAGSNITLDLTELSQPFSIINGVFKNGQLLTVSDPTFGWSRLGNTITVLTATTDDLFQVDYTYGGAPAPGTSITVQDIDGTPTVNDVTAIKFSNGSVTDNGDGTVTVTTGTYTDEQAQDAVGSIFDTTLVYVDATPLIKRAPITGDVSIPDGSNTAAISAGVIVDADINASAAIDASKIANGSVSNTEFQRLDGVTGGIQTQLDGKQATGNYVTALTGDVTASGPGSAASTVKNALKDFAHGFTTSGTVVTGKVKGFYTHFQAATLVGWNITVDTGTMTVKTWKIASGTAKPTIANVISTSGVAISTGTAVQSTTMSDFTSTAVSAGDIFAWDITAVSGVGEATFELIFRNS